MTKPILYLGLDLPHSLSGKEVVHLPMIEIFPFSNEELMSQPAILHFPTYTHLILTSKNAVKKLLDLNFPLESWKNKQILSIGQGTSQFLEKQVSPLSIRTSALETSEGVIEMLNEMDLKEASLFWPHSALSRHIISEYCTKRDCTFSDCAVYTTKEIIYSSPPNLNQFSEIIFTSPSTVKAFSHNYKTVPENIKLSAIGPVSQLALFKTFHADA